MIDSSALKDEDLGRAVVYEDFRGIEEGRLTGWNDRYIFVRFKGPGGEACMPESVRFAHTGSSV